MNSPTICTNCQTENPFYALNCKNCKAYLRSRVVNIDLWQFIGKLIESPMKGFTNIVLAEHKNFVMVLTLTAGFKYFLNSIILSQALNINVNSINHLFTNLMISEGYFIALILLIAFLVTLLNSAFGSKNRFRDNFSIYVFSLIPLIIAMFFLVPVEYALFGKHWFYFNPPPYIIKPLVAWVILSIEGLMILWSVLLAIIATYTQTRNKIYSSIVGLAVIAILFLGMIYLPMYPF